MNFKNELLEGHRLVSRCPDHRHVKVEQGPPGGMLGRLS
jgi:hypothetical protein